MKRVLPMLLIALVLLLMGAKDLPRPCVGDGQGNPCSIERCQCTTLCSCKATCTIPPPQPEALESGMAERDASVLMCRTLPEPELQAPPQTAACHVEGASASHLPLAHFSLPGSAIPVLLARPLDPRLLAWGGADARFTEPRTPATRLLPPPEPPPRLRA